MTLPPISQPRPFSDHFENYHPRGRTLEFDTPTTWFCKRCGTAMARAGESRNGKVKLTCGHVANEIGDACANVA